MKQYIALILACYTLFVACNSTKEFVDNDDVCDFNDTVLPQEKFFIPDAKQDSILSRKGYVELINNSLVNNTLYSHPTYNTITNKQTNKHKKSSSL